MKPTLGLVLNVFLISCLLGCTQPKESATEVDTESKPQASSTPPGAPRPISEKEARSITLRSFKADEPLPPIEDFSMRDTIIHSVRQKNPRLDLQNLRYYDRKVKRSDLLPLQGAEASHITVLVISNLQLDDVDIEPISKMNLLRLSLAYNPVRDLHALRSMKSLRDLNLDYSQINAEGLRVAASITNLTALRLNGTTISDADLPLLYSMKRLQEVDLNECKNISPSGVAKLKQALPGIIVQTGSQQKGFHKIDLSDLKTVEQGLMRQREYAEADLALQKFISKWKEQESPPRALLAEAYRLRGECQKALGHASTSEEMFVESSKFGGRSKDLKNHSE